LLIHHVALQAPTLPARDKVIFSGLGFFRADSFKMKEDDCKMVVECGGGSLLAKSKVTDKTIILTEGGYLHLREARIIIN
jgi:hypothetical protein